MEEEKSLFNEVASEVYDAADRPFDFVGEGSTTALVCESDPTLRGKIVGAIKALGYQVTTPETAKDGLKGMRFHVFDLIVVNERFDTDNPDMNSVLRYLENLNMATRRRSFVALLGERYRTMDNMAAFNRSVNLVIHMDSIDDMGKIIKQGVADNTAFYHVFNDTLVKMGKA